MVAAITWGVRNCPVGQELRFFCYGGVVIFLPRVLGRKTPPQFATEIIAGVGSQIELIVISGGILLCHAPPGGTITSTQVILFTAVQSMEVPIGEKTTPIGRVGEHSASNSLNSAKNRRLGVGVTR